MLSKESGDQWREDLHIFSKVSPELIDLLHLSFHQRNHIDDSNWDEFASEHVERRRAVRDLSLFFCHQNSAHHCGRLLLYLFLLLLFLWMLWILIYFKTVLFKLLRCYGFADLHLTRRVVKPIINNFLERFDLVLVSMVEVLEWISD